MDPQTSGPTQVQTNGSDRMPGWQAAVTAALAAVLYLVLIDAAIETFWSGSPLRWWVLGVVLVYFGATFIVWRGLPAVWSWVGWSGGIIVSAFVGIGLLALTVWMPGGPERGIRAIGLPTPGVLCLSAAFSTVLAAMMLISSPRVPSAGKWIVGVLSLYGVVAFVVGAVGRVPYGYLLNGGGFWGLLPRALQGPFIAGAVILPLAIVIRILDRVLPTRSAPPQPWRPRQLIALVLVAVMATAGLQLPPASGSVGASGSEAARDAIPACGRDCGHASAATILAPYDKAYTDFKRLATSGTGSPQLTGIQAKERLDYLFDAMEVARKEIRRETFDPKAIIEKVGADPRVLFSWMRDNTVLVPYRGVLRGPVGVLMDRVGNSLDRSLLLAELLRAAGHKSRLAHATLSDDQARALAATLKSDRPAVPAAPSADSGAALGFLDEYARRFQVDSRTARDSAEALRRQSAQALAAGSERAVQQAKFIEKALGDLVPRESRPDPALVDALRDHWWTQVQQNDAWVDLDLAAAKGEPGRTLAPVAETTETAGLSADLFQTVTIRTVIEQWTPDRVDTHTILEQTLRPIDILGQSIMLTHMPMSWPEDLDLSKEAKPLERVKSLVQDEGEWRPTLAVGDKTIVQSSVGDDGEVNTHPGRPRQAPTQVGGLFGAMTGGQSAAPKGNGIWSAEWIEFDIKTPGQPQRTIRRDVFDLVGPAARAAKDWSFASGIANRRLERGLALAGQTEIMIVGWDLSPDYVADALATGLLSQRTSLSELMITSGTNGLRKVTEELARGPRRPNRLLGFALARQTLGNPSGPVYLADPNVFALNEGVNAARDGRLLAYREFDIVHNRVGVMPTRDLNPFLVRLRHGVADTNAEALAVSNCCGNQPATIVNTAETLAATMDQTGDWFVARRAADISADRINLAPDVRTRLQGELAGGALLLMNRSRTGRTSQNPMNCWRINRETGDAVGLGENGAGQAVVGYVIIALKVSMFLYCILVEYPNAKYYNQDRVWNHCVFWFLVGGATFGVELAADLAKLTVILMFAIELLAEGASKLAKENE